MKQIEKLVMNAQQKLLSCLKVQFLSMEDIKSLTRSLANKISKVYSPDIIVGIERGGNYPAYCLSKEMQLPYTTIDISRSRRYVGDTETDNILLLPKLLKKSQEEPLIKKQFECETSVKKAMIIDDDCGSMKTLNMAQLHLKEKGLESKTSVILSTPRGIPSFFAGMQLPLSKLIKGNKRFPWCQYSPYYKDYQLWEASQTNLP
jgi:hypoxanthine phosphoribosyltransferase